MKKDAGNSSHPFPMLKPRRLPALRRKITGPGRKSVYFRSGYLPALRWHRGHSFLLPDERCPGCCHALGVATAAAYKFYAFDCVAVQINMDQTGTDAVWDIFHDLMPPLEYLSIFLLSVTKIITESIR